MWGRRLGFIPNTMRKSVNIASVEIGTAYLLRLRVLYNYFGWSEEFITYVAPYNSSAEGRRNNKKQQQQ
jgi:hypothetical protein